MYDDGLGVKKCQQGILAGEKLKKSCVFFGCQMERDILRVSCRSITWNQQRYFVDRLPFGRGVHSIATSRTNHAHAISRGFTHHMEATTKICSEVGRVLACLFVEQKLVFCSGFYVKGVKVLCKHLAYSVYLRIEG